jgi:CHAT domain-containing protein
LRIREQQLGPDHPHTAASLNNLGMLYWAMGRWPEAEPFLQRALQICEQQLGPAHPDTATSLNNLAILLTANTTRPLELLSLMQQAAAIRNRQINQVFTISSNNQRLAYLDTLTGELDQFLSLVLRYHSSDTSAVRAALDLVLRRKAIVAEASAAQHAAVLGGQYPELQAQRQALRNKSDELSHQRGHFPTQQEAIPAHRQRLAQLETEYDRLEADLARQIPELGLEQRLRGATHTAIARVLPPGAVLVEVKRFDVFDFKAVRERKEPQWLPARYLAFVLPADAPENVCMIDLGPADEVDTLVEAFRESIEQEGEQEGESRDAEQHQLLHEQSHANGHALRQTVFEPLKTALNGCTRLFLSPDGGLAHLPFEVLPMADGHFLLDTYDISYLSVGRDVLRFDAPSSGVPTAPLVIANPDFDLYEKHAPVEGGMASAAQENGKTGRGIRALRGKVKKLGPLPAAEVEGERIARLLGVKAWVGHEARKSILLSSHSPGIVHLSTHGLVLSDQEYASEVSNFAHMQRHVSNMSGIHPFSRPGWENPMLRSMLALAGFNTWLTGKPLPEDAGDGLANGEDVSGLNLLHTDMVVLSLCVSGLGNYRTGEGVFGLRRAFVLAGAKTLVMTLWKVDDLASAILMERFYQCLLHDPSMPRLDALRAAQRYTREVTVGQLKRSGWLDAMIEELTEKDTEAGANLRKLADKPDEYQPYEHPYFWGAFICQGDPRRLPLSEA